MSLKPELPALPESSNYNKVSLAEVNALLIDFKENPARFEFSVIHEDEGNLHEVLIDETISNPQITKYPAESVNVNGTHFLSYNQGGEDRQIAISPDQFMFTRQPYDGVDASILVVCWDSTASNNKNFMRLVSTPAAQ